MQLSVIIPCYNAATTIAVQLEALASQEWHQPWEVIVADNGSTDNTVAVAELFQAKIPSLRIVDASAKKGAAYARNCGAKLAQAEALAFCDADDEVAPGWVAAMGEALVKYDFISGRNFHHKLNESWVIQLHGSPESVGIIENPYLPFVISCNMGVKRAVHEAVGGFDENFAKIEDIDYSWCIQEKGFKVHEVPEAIVNYRLRKRFSAICQRAWGVGLYEALLYKKHKHYGMPKILMSSRSFIKVPLDFVLEAVSLKIRDRSAIQKWLPMLAWRAGQLQGCFKFGYLPPV